MKIRIVLVIMFVAFLLTACQETISESVMETAVSQVILTSASEDTTTDTETESTSEELTIKNEQIEELNTHLENANLQLTDQAVEIDALKSELEGVYILLTPTMTPTPQDTPTPTITPSPTPPPPPTEVVIPWYHKYVTAKRDAPIYYFEDKNAAGHPIMLKTSPVVKISSGTEFLVDINRVRADGGAYYYLIVGPKHEGYYVSIDDVKNTE